MPEIKFQDCCSFIDHLNIASKTEKEKKYLVQNAGTSVYKIAPNSKGKNLNTAKIASVAHDCIDSLRKESILDKSVKYDSVPTAQVPTELSNGSQKLKDDFLDAQVTRISLETRINKVTTLDNSLVDFAKRVENSIKARWWYRIIRPIVRWITRWDVKQPDSILKASAKAKKLLEELNQKKTQALAKEDEAKKALEKEKNELANKPIPPVEQPAAVIPQPSVQRNDNIPPHPAAKEEPKPAQPAPVNPPQPAPAPVDIQPPTPPQAIPKPQPLETPKPQEGTPAAAPEPENEPPKATVIEDRSELSEKKKKEEEEFKSKFDRLIAALNIEEKLKKITTADMDFTGSTIAELLEIKKGLKFEIFTRSIVINEYKEKIKALISQLEEAWKAREIALKNSLPKRMAAEKLIKEVEAALVKLNVDEQIKKIRGLEYSIALIIADSLAGNLTRLIKKLDIRDKTSEIKELDTRLKKHRITIKLIIKYKVDKIEESKAASLTVNLEEKIQLMIQKRAELDQLYEQFVTNAKSADSAEKLNQCYDAAIKPIIAIFYILKEQEELTDIRVSSRASEELAYIRDKINQITLLNKELAAQLDNSKPDQDDISAILKKYDWKTIEANAENNKSLKDVVIHLIQIRDVKKDAIMEFLRLDQMPQDINDFNKLKNEMTMLIQPDRITTDKESKEYAAATEIFNAANEVFFWVIGHYYQVENLK